MINFIKTLYSSEQQDFSKLKKSISYAFDQRYGQSALFRREAADNNRPKFFKYNMRSLDKRDGVDLQNFFQNSPHLDQVQYSKFIKIDDDFINQADTIKRSMKGGGAVLNAFQ